MTTQKSKVVVTRDLGTDVLGRLRENPNVDMVVWPQDCLCDRNWLLENVEGAVGLVVILTDKVDEEVLAKAGANLKVVSTMSVGYEHVDLEGLAKRGVRLGYTPDVLNDAVADLSVMLALMAGRNGGKALEHVKNGEVGRPVLSEELVIDPAEPVISGRTHLGLPLVGVDPN